MMQRLRAAWPALLVLGGAAACAAGFLVHRAELPFHGQRVGQMIVLVLVWLAASAVLRLWRGWHLANALALIAALALAGFCGPLSVAAALLVATAGAAVGSWLVPEEAPARAVLATLVGVVAIAGVAGWLLPLPVHRRIVYLPLLLALCFARRRELGALASGAVRSWRAAIDAAPLASAFAIAMLGIASTAAWLPTAQSDDLSYHLGLPSQLLRDGRYALDPTHQIWTLAPWLGDVLHGIAQVLAGREARGAVDMLWLAAVAALARALARALRADEATGAWAAATAASLPLLVVLASGMQTELPATALTLALALVVVEGNRKLLPAAGVLAGGLAALKLGHAVAAVALALWALARTRARVDARGLAVALALLVAVAASSYAYAGWISGNPLLPLFNDVFRSPVMAPVQLYDARWHAGFGWHLPWALTFATKRYLEADDGGFGFALIALAGAWMLALVRPRLRGAAIAAAAILLLALAPMQYARYAVPGLAMLVPVALVAAREAIGARALATLAAALCALNFAYQPNAGWTQSSSARPRYVTSGGDAREVFRRFTPERMLIARVRAEDDGDSIVLALDPDAPYVAELGTRGRSVAWYDPALERARIAAEKDASGEGWRALIETANARWLMLRPERASEALKRGLALTGATRVESIGNAELWRRP